MSVWVRRMSGSPPIEKLTDVIFGFALAVGALSLTGAQPQTMSAMAGGLFMFGLSFVILVVVWWGHSDLMSKLGSGKSKVVVINIVLLFFVAVEPYLLNSLNFGLALFSLASTLYAVDMAFLMGISGVLCRILVTENEGTLSILAKRQVFLRVK